MGLEDVEEVFGIARDIAGPLAEAAVSVYGLDPLGQEFAFGPILLAVLAFDFEDQHFAVRETDEVVGAVFEDDALEDVKDFKAEMVIFHPRRDIGIAIELEGFAGFPTGIEDTEIDVRADR